MLKGIDVSDNQGVIDWKKVKADGIQVAILRSVRGSGKSDYQFENNYKGCKNNDIAVGVYKYSYATTLDQAINEANAVVKLLAGRKLECKVWLDVEDQCQRAIGKSALTQIIMTFRDIIVNAGYDFGIYCNLDWYKNVLDVTRIKEFCNNWWIARYGKNNGAADYSVKPEMANCGWQYSSAGSVNGINGNVDMDEFYAAPQNCYVSNVTPFVGMAVKVSSYYNAPNDDISKAIIKNAQGIISEVVPGTNPYKIDGVGYCNAGDIREDITRKIIALSYKHYVGEKITVSSHYSGCNDGIEKAVILDRYIEMNIDRIEVGANNPYHTNFNTWVNDGDIR